MSLPEPLRFPARATLEIGCPAFGALPSNSMRLRSTPKDQNAEQFSCHGIASPLPGRAAATPTRLILGDYESVTIARVSALSISKRLLANSQLVAHPSGLARAHVSALRWASNTTCDPSLSFVSRLDAFPGAAPPRRIRSESGDSTSPNRSRSKDHFGWHSPRVLRLSRTHLIPEAIRRIRQT
jgi:hypothetical protein